MEREERPRPAPGAHLSVHQPSEGRSQPHLQHLESVHVLLLKQCLQAGGEEHQHGEEIALPGRGVGVPNKLQEEACRRRGREKVVREGAHGYCLCLSLARSGGPDSTGGSSVFAEVVATISPTAHAHFQHDLHLQSTGGVFILTCYG